MNCNAVAANKCLVLVVFMRRAGSTSDPDPPSLTKIKDPLSTVLLPSNESIDDTKEEEIEQEKPAASDVDLATFLISRACKNSSLANYFYW